MVQNRVKELRKEHKMTQIRLSIELEVSQETISAYEHGKQRPSIATLLKMRILFHASTDYILGLSDIRNPINPKDFTEKEILMLERYRSLSNHNQDMISAYLSGLQGQPLNDV